jgi:hypothetical protein
MGEEESSLNLTAPGCKQFYIAYDIQLILVGLHLNIDSLQIALDLDNIVGDQNNH